MPIWMPLVIIAGAAVAFWVLAAISTALLSEEYGEDEE